jgi:uncharacterized membrane protein YgaE (UPF0421/DUF939 family)
MIDWRIFRTILAVVLVLAAGYVLLGLTIAVIDGLS